MSCSTDLIRVRTLYSEQPFFMRYSNIQLTRTKICNCFQGTILLWPPRRVSTCRLGNASFHHIARPFTHHFPLMALYSAHTNGFLSRRSRHGVKIPDLLTELTWDQRSRTTRTEMASAASITPRSLSVTMASGTLLTHARSALSGHSLNGCRHFYFPPRLLRRARIVDAAVKGRSAKLTLTITSGYGAPSRWESSWT